MTERDELIKQLRDTASKGVSVWGDLQIAAAAMLEADGKQEPEVWFCPDCGNVSDAQTRCCPDWIRARKVTKNFALTCRATFDRTIAPVAQKNEPVAWKGCACRWDDQDIRVATCERHQGWLDVVGEWADRAKIAEASLGAKNDTR